MLSDHVDIDDFKYMPLPEQEHFAQLLADDLKKANPAQVRAWCESVARYIKPLYLNTYIFAHEECGQRLPIFGTKKGE
jgi:hypothetical protein